MGIPRFLWGIVVLALGLGIAVVLYIRSGGTGQGGAFGDLLSVAAYVLAQALGMIGDILNYLRSQIPGGRA